MPKKLGVIKEKNPSALAISYKLETDATILESKATMSLSKYSMDIVIANLLQSFRTECTVYRAATQEGDDPQKTKLMLTGEPEESSLEAKIVANIYSNYL